MPGRAVRFGQMHGFAAHPFGRTRDQVAAGAECVREQKLDAAVPGRVQMISRLRPELGPTRATGRSRSRSVIGIRASRCVMYAPRVSPVCGRCADRCRHAISIIFPGDVAGEDREAVPQAGYPHFRNDQRRNAR